MLDKRELSSPVSYQLQGIIQVNWLCMELAHARVWGQRPLNEGGLRKITVLEDLDHMGLIAVA